MQCSFIGRFIALISISHHLGFSNRQIYYDDYFEALTSHASAWNTDMMMAPVQIVQQANTACTLNGRYA